ncbi:hemin ABC transporter, permease protein, putative [Marinomonas sp. MED121]|uniref:FecCD family ABC transporter permease n=1 Tax=Marinomonas sp. MED121 TaxID=314277 RepID=UPI000068FAA6|nr:iron chelate uptake ABC transporter family permease subunit [Marinomonas sp. MED121]EAQ63915.1 hemin ABC transporter, permease protein, putative [Marinomonas sp. MED121]
MMSLDSTPVSVCVLSKREKRVRFAIILLVSALILTILASVGIGPMSVSMLDSLSVISAKLGLHESNVNGVVETVITQIRLPRTLLAMLVGAALAVCGAAMQGLFRNPLADPGLVGVTGGASLAAVSMIVLGGTALSFINQILGQYSLMLVSFLGALITTSLVSRIATTKYGTSVTSMLLAGIAIGIVTGAAVGFLTYFADDSQLRSLTFWAMGSVGGATWQTVLSAGSLIAVPLILIPLQAKQLNALLLGESEARHLGIDVERVKRRLIFLTAVAVGACVSVSGMIGFVGLIVPHLVRLTLGPDHRYLLPLSALLGALFLLIADILSRTIIAPAELPIGLITTLIGGPFFIGMVVYRARSNAL